MDLDTFVKQSFLVSYMILFATTIITFIESLRTNNIRARHILNLETAISLIAGYMYYIFIQKLRDPKTELRDITYYRYLDWFITTPLMLLAIMLVFNFYQKTLVPLSVYFAVILFNFGMLLSGYLGETQRIPKFYAAIIGFVFFVAFMATIWLFVASRDDKHAHIPVFVIFTVIWSIYGIAYLQNERVKNLLYNILDVIAKSIFGLFMWMYYGKVLAF